MNNRGSAGRVLALQRALARPLIFAIALSVAGIAFAATGTVGIGKLPTGAKSTLASAPALKKAPGSLKSTPSSDSAALLAALGATPISQTAGAASITPLSIGDPVATMSINAGSVITSSTAAFIDSDVSDAVSMSFSQVFAQIDSGMSWSAGIATDGTLWRWGSLGGTVTSLPLQVGGDSDWSQVSVGSDAAALKTDGTVWTFTGTSSPVKQGSGTYRTVSAGSGHFLAINTAGNLSAWGNNAQGQLGTGNRTTAWTPIVINGGTNWTSVSAGNWH